MTVRNRIVFFTGKASELDLLRWLIAERLGCDLVTVETVDEFFAELDASRPAVIVSDSKIANANPMAVMQATRKKLPAVPYIFCSDDTSVFVISEALRKGATSWVSRDFAFTQLIGELTRLGIHASI